MAEWARGESRSRIALLEFKAAGRDRGISEERPGDDRLPRLDEMGGQLPGCGNRIQILQRKFGRLARGRREPQRTGTVQGRSARVQKCDLDDRSQGSDLGGVIPEYRGDQKQSITGGPIDPLPFQGLNLKYPEAGEFRITRRNRFHLLPEAAEQYDGDQGSGHRPAEETPRGLEKRPGRRGPLGILNAPGGRSHFQGFQVQASYRDPGGIRFPIRWRIFTNSRIRRRLVRKNLGTRRPLRSDFSATSRTAPRASSSGHPNSIRAYFPAAIWALDPQGILLQNPTLEK